MEALYLWLNTLVNKNKTDFTGWDGIQWLHPYNSSEAQAVRDKLLAENEGRELFKGTKPFYKQISKGCTTCGAGNWSCLFITGKCNAGCFYCPAPQQMDEAPSSQGLTFNTPLEYANYVRFFNFKGVSFSGGEPLLFFERTLDYLNAVRKTCHPDIYIWMYTNGILANKEKLQKLADAGLDEIRFDIGATNFSLDKVKLAKGIISNITIEIPAVPEEKERLIKLLPAMEKAGVTNLNLHQLRLTKHNVKHLSKRKYTYINAEKPLVLESELAALEIIKAAQEVELGMGVNYCAFHYKNRFQKAGFRRILAQTIATPGGDLSENGYLRVRTHNAISYKTIRFTDVPPTDTTWNTLPVGDKVYFYKTETVFKAENLSSINEQDIDNLLLRYPKQVPTDPLLFRIWQLEYIEKGLREY